ncbi:MAG: ABC transporter ATP-binding protein [Bacilli bacterium]|jgi:ABC-type lipoprotein export system ATPase subunit|nr:ABC transporter ATP-binding protein [Bacilli bacterium]
MKETIIELKNVSKEFKRKNETIKALDDISINFEAGKFYAIMGHSGSGKSTAINIISMLEDITSGTYKINGIDTKNLSSDEIADLRKDYIGLVFQDFYLDEHLKAYENVILPMIINSKIKKEERKERALELLETVDLSERINHFPKELSGGECQRVAIARALANNPHVILADEPTGDLDEENEHKIFKILKRLSEEGKCIIVVSHSNEVKKYADIIYNLKKGKLVEE